MEDLKIEIKLFPTKNSDCLTIVMLLLKNLSKFNNFINWSLKL